MAGSDSAQQPATLRELRHTQRQHARHGGGAPKVMRDLHDEYLARGIDAWIAVGHSPGRTSARCSSTTTRRAAGGQRAMKRAAEAIAGTQATPQDRPETAQAHSAFARVASDPARYRDILAGVEDVGYPATAATA